MNYWDLVYYLVPETIVALTVVWVLFVDSCFLQKTQPNFRTTWNIVIAILGCVVAQGWIVFHSQELSIATSLPPMLALTPTTQLLKQVIIFLAIGTFIISAETRFTCHIGEYISLVLFAAIGFMLMISSENILMIFISLELASLSLYILTAFAKHDAKGNEAAVKYFLFGGVSAAFLLFGFSWIYGLTGETELSRIALKIKDLGMSPLLMAATAMVLIGFGFKIAVVPFQLWAPDVYQAAPLPTAALVASGSKIASFYLLTTFLHVGFKGMEGSVNWGNWLTGWMPLLAVMATFSMVLGNLAAIMQSSVKRLLAYSAIAHAGYILLGVMSANEDGMTSVLYYAVTYALTTLGAFGVVAIVTEQNGSDDLAQFGGLSRRSPVLACCMLIFLLSLAGIPPLAGFFGKFYLFTNALRSNASMGLLWLVILAIGMSAVSLYYYLQILKQIYVKEAPPVAPLLNPSGITQLYLVVLALAVLLLGCMPQWLIARL